MLTIKILYVTTVSNTINAFLVPHIRMLQSEGHEVDVACNVVQPFVEEFINLNCKVFKVPFSRNPFGRNNLQAYKIIKDILEKDNYDVVHTHTPVASAIVRIVCRKKSDIKVYYTAHGFHFYKGASLRNWCIYYPVEKYLSKFTDKLLTINDEDFERAKKRFKAKEVILVHGVGLNLSEFNYKLKKETDVVTLISVGELNDNKNHRSIIEALKKYRDKYVDDNWKYFICGTGPLKDDLQELINKYSLQNNIKLLGFRTDIKELLNSSDYFIFPSYREGLPVSVMEAMASRVCVVASNIRGNSDLIKNEVTGILFDVDEENSIEQAIYRILYLKDFDKDKIESNAAHEIKNYGLEKVLKELQLLYE